MRRVLGHHAPPFSPEDGPPCEPGDDPFEEFLENTFREANETGLAKGMTLWQLVRRVGILKMQLKDYIKR